MDLQDQLKNLFPEHKPSESIESNKNSKQLWMQEEPIICKYEKRKGKPITILEGYTGKSEDFKELAKLELTDLEQKQQGFLATLKDLTNPKRQGKDRDLIIEIRAGTGGHARGALRTKHPRAAGARAVRGDRRLLHPAVGGPGQQQAEG